MNYFIATIPPTLAEKLKEKGKPIDVIVNFAGTGKNIDLAPTYASAFDWLIEKGIHIAIKPIFGESSTRYSWVINYKSTISVYPTWHEAAEQAIEKALKLI